MGKETSANRAAEGRRSRTDDAATTITRQVTHYQYLVGAMAYYTIKHCKETSANRAAEGRRSRTDDAATTITRQVTHYQYLVGAMAYYTIKHCSTSQQWAVSVRGNQCEQSSSRETQDDAATTITRQACNASQARRAVTVTVRCMSQLAVPAYARPPDTTQQYCPNRSSRRHLTLHAYNTYFLPGIS
ncbi:hypothetical protein J6590_013012 [Homalodisca vitripennis]|nr:hypothetical protein J6590_013012 [Homalodisca vitripennis]